MRTRRQLIVTGGTAVSLGIAGCLEELPEEEEEEDDDEPEEPEEPENDEEEEENDEEEEVDDEEEEPEPEPARFEITSIDAPATVEIGRDFDWTFTVRNDGEVDGVFETTVTRRRTDGETETHETVSVDVSADDTATVTRTTSHEFLGRYVYTVEETGDTFGVRAVEHAVQFGESYTNPDGVDMTLTSTSDFFDIELKGSYTYTDEQGNRRRVRAGDGMRFALVHVEARKSTREPKEMPEPEEFVMFVGEDEYESVERLADDAYEGGRSRVSRRGIIMFEIDDRYQRTDDFDVYWTRVYPGGTAEAVWSV